MIPSRIGDAKLRTQNAIATPSMDSSFLYDVALYSSINLKYLSLRKKYK